MTEPEHITDGSPCWCNPRVEHYDGGDVIIHRSSAEITADSIIRPNSFHAHLDVCPRCAANPFDLCGEGQRLLKIAAEGEWK